MSRAGLVRLVMLGLIISGCEENSAPGNDREAQLSPPSPPAEIASVGAAIEGVENDLLLPQPMTNGDLRNVPGGTGGCFFSYTRVGLPVVAYGAAATVKLNDKLVPLTALGEGQFGAGELSVTVVPMEEPRRDGEPFVVQMVLWLPGADHERGFQGFSRCEDSAAGA